APGDKPGKRLLGIQGHVIAPGRGGPQINARVRHPVLERQPVLWRSDDNSHPAVPDTLRQVAARLPGQFLAVAIELDDMVARAEPAKSSRSAHDYSIQCRILSALSIPAGHAGRTGLARAGSNSNGGRWRCRKTRYRPMLLLTGM